MKGSCLCGVVRFELKKLQNNYYQCFCSLCRKQSGSISNTATLVSRSDFLWTHGESNIQQLSLETGFTSSFCSSCGSPVPNLVRGSKYMWIPFGLVDAQNAEVVAKINVCPQFQVLQDKSCCVELENTPSLDELMLMLEK